MLTISENDYELISELMSLDTYYFDKSIPLVFHDE
jgi:hypothetical protein